MNRCTYSIVLTGALLLMLLAVGCNAQHQEPAAQQNTPNLHNIPIGTSSSELERLFNDNKLPYVYETREELVATAALTVKPGLAESLQGLDFKGRYHAAIHDPVRHGFPRSDTLWIFVYVDADGKVLRVDYEPIYTFL
jgi:hypothetical protein